MQPAVVTGGGRGIAKRLAGRGYAVLLTARDADAGRRATESGARPAAHSRRAGDPSTST
jgi:NAD(P)-dependent dehydrogenase (short-subunit alcohol dehydrogenase family)